MTVPIDHTRRHGRVTEWIRPTAVQQEILQALSTGRSYEQAATALGLGTRTIRRRFRELTAANGVDRLLPAGALFEALGWHESRGTRLTLTAGRPRRYGLDGRGL